MHAFDARPIGVCTGLIISLPSYALVQIQATAAVTSVTSSITSPSRDQGSAAGYTFQNRLAPGVIGYEPRHQTMGLESTPVVSKKSLCRGFVLLTSAFLFTGAPVLSQSSSPLISKGYSVLPVPQKVTLTGKDFALDGRWRSEEHTSELQSRLHLVCRLLLEKKKNKAISDIYMAKTEL